jgi:hypothetical protein
LVIKKKINKDLILTINLFKKVKFNLIIANLIGRIQEYKNISKMANNFIIKHHNKNLKIKKNKIKKRKINNQKNKLKRKK